jgi:O-antigen/teichoic acid export membrane protein
VSAPPHSAVPRQSFARAFVTASTAQTVSALLTALSLAVVSRRFGSDDLGLYTLERRGMALLQPLMLVGLSVALTRYIALERGRRVQAHREQATAAVTLSVLTAGLLGLVMVVFPRPVAEVMFADADAVDLVYALAGFAFATVLFQLAYSAFRGHERLLAANLLELVVMGGLPLVLALVGPTDVVRFIWALNLAVVAATGLALGRPGVLSGMFTIRVRASVRSHARHLLRYGLARTPGDIAVVLLFVIPPVAVVQFATTSAAGYTSVVLSSVNLVAVCAVPLGVLLLPRVAVDLGTPEGIDRRKYALLAGATFDTGILLSGVLLMASPLVISLWIPHPADAIVDAERLASLGVPGYVFHVVMRSYLDASDTRPLSSLSTVTGLVTLAAVLLPLLAATDMDATVSAAVALAVGMTAMGGTTFTMVARRLPGFVGGRTLASLSAWLVLSGAVSVVISSKGLPATFAASTCGLAVAVAVPLLLRREWALTLLESARGLSARPGSAP